jgi:hypothetical protein
LRLDREENFGGMTMIRILAAFLFTLVMAQTAFAQEYVSIPDASTLLTETSADGKFWFRNLTTYNSALLPGNYVYYLDTTTAAGRSMHAWILFRMGTHQPMDISIYPQGNGPMPINSVANYGW